MIQPHDAPIHADRHAVHAEEAVTNDAAELKPRSALERGG